MRTYPRGNPRETCPEVDGVVYSAEVYKIPRVRMQVEPTDKVSNVRGGGGGGKGLIEMSIQAKAW